MKDQLEKIKEDALKQIEASDALEKLNEIRVAYLGKKGELTSVLKSMKDVPPEERPKVGQMVNDAAPSSKTGWRRPSVSGKEGERRADKKRDHRRDPSCKEKQCRPQPSEHHCAGRSGAHLRRHGLRSGGRPGSGV